MRNSKSNSKYLVSALLIFNPFLSNIYLYRSCVPTCKYKIKYYLSKMFHIFFLLLIKMATHVVTRSVEYYSVGVPYILHNLYNRKYKYVFIFFYKYAF